ncbi:hypothetical protein EFA46_013685 (plasmid) [Halarchaeum sp. CBA1220]|uniref:hypothetical protein n=1 Tax=Halarchaeum sp. CBA1220 TaxID=1853682 RepID=UPI0011CDDE73|nr:hypothetical protein [Halarchaeum sp. CBA1220]QLC35312.1 hypothetical protein EFA46_013685 [Halarchaeum sp. CBA1220]
MSESPPWEPAVVVVGLGAAGTASVERIDTDTAATLRTVDDPPETPASLRDAVVDAAFVFLTGDAAEAGVVGCAHDLARSTGACSVFVAEGLSDVPSELTAALNLVVPIERDAVSPLVVSSLLADLFEAMMTPTVRALGHGDVRVVAGDGRVGRLAIRPPDDDDPTWVSPRVGGEREAALVFVCAERERSPATVERAAGVADGVGLGALLWDQRIHERYADASHVKRLVTVDPEASPGAPRD